MKKNCGLVEDLLPLYLDEMCGEESKQLIEEHLAECENCRALYDSLKANDSPPLPPQDGTAVLQKTARVFHRRAVRQAAGVTAIVLYWLIFGWMNHFAYMGDYRYFSYSFYEAFSFGVVIVPLVTLFWLGFLVVRAVRRHDFARDRVLIVTLALLVVLRAGFLWQRFGTVSYTNYTQVVDIPDESHVVILQNEHPITLEGPAAIIRLLREDDSVYGFIYDWNPRHPNEGKLYGAYDAQKQLEEPQ